MNWVSSSFANGRISLSVDAATAYRAALRAVTECKFAVMDADPGVPFMRVQTPGGERHWDGTLALSFIDEKKGTCTVQIVGTLTGGMMGASNASITAMGLARGKLDSALKKWARKIPAAKPEVAAAAPASAPSASVADELLKLAELHRSGALTDDEFAALKARHLG